MYVFVYVFATHAFAGFVRILFSVGQNAQKQGPPERPEWGPPRTAGKRPSRRVADVNGAIAVVGIGADGWEGLPESSRRVLRTAEVLIGAPRQLDLLPAA